MVDIKSRFKIVAIIIIMVFFMAGTMTVHATTSVSVTKASYQTTVGQTLYFTKTHSSKSKAKWSSSVKTVATAGSAVKTGKGSKSKISCKSAGTTYIKCKVGSKTYKCKLTVKKLSTPKVKAVNNMDSIKVSWNKIKGASGYELYKKTGDGGYKLLKTVTSGSTISYIDKSYVKGTDYGYKVIATKGDYRSGEGKADIRRLTAPTVTVKQNLAKIQVSWKAIAGASGYKVYRIYSDGSVKCVKTISGKSNVKYTTGDKSCGSTYKYGVKAVYGSSASAYKTNAKSLKIAHRYTKTVTRKATCTHGSKVKETCKICGRTSTYTVKDFVPHKWGEWTPISGTSKMKRVCSVCKREAKTPAMTGNPIIDTAFMHIGSPYVLHGGSYEEGIDCAHFVWKVLRDSIGYDTGFHKSYMWSEYGTEVKPEDAAMGDVLVVDGHVMFYLGGGSVVHAASWKAYPDGGVRVSNYGDDIYDIIERYELNGKTWLGIRRFYESPVIEIPDVVVEETDIVDDGIDADNDEDESDEIVDEQQDVTEEDQSADGTEA